MLSDEKKVSKRLRSVSNLWPSDMRIVIWLTDEIIAGKCYFYLNPPLIALQHPLAVRLARRPQVTETVQTEEKSEVDEQRTDCPIHAFTHKALTKNKLQSLSNTDDYNEWSGKLMK